MSFNAKQYDSDKFVEGVWEEFQGGQFKIAKAGNHIFLDAKRRLDKEHSQKYDGGIVPAKAEQEKLCLAIAEGILRDWKEVVDDCGEPLLYDIEAAAATLDGHPPLIEFVLSKANELDRFDRDEVSREAKKPLTS